jgi:AcrR family transcriptional regulator
MTAADYRRRAEGLRERNKRARTERILHAARELLRERDVETVTLEQIAERAEVAPGTVFNLVGPRERLFAALIDQAHEQLEEELAKASDDDPLARIRRIVATLVRIFLADREVYRQVLKQWPESGTLLRSSPYRPIREAISEGQAAGLLCSEVDPGRVAAAILAGCVGALHQWSASIISDPAFRERCLYGADLALAAIAAEDMRPAVLGRLAKRIESAT